MKITFNPRNFEPGTHWVNVGGVLSAVALLALLVLLVCTLATR